MEPKIGQVWEWDIDREHISILVVNDMIPSTHEIEVSCKILEGTNSNTEFQTSIGSFNSPNWRLLYKSLENYNNRRA